MELVPERLYHGQVKFLNIILKRPVKTKLVVVDSLRDERPSLGIAAEKSSDFQQTYSSQRN